MQKITPFLWFDTQAEEAANLYVSVFKNSKLGSISRYDEAGAKASGQPVGSAMVVPFTLDGQDFLALNGGPVFKFTEAVSFAVSCENQQEIDTFWEKLSAGGSEGDCGWLKDKFGLSWQITPSIMGELMGGKNAEGSKRAMQAMLTMHKLDIQKLKDAYDGK